MTLTTVDSRQSTTDNRLTHFKTRAAKGLARVITKVTLIVAMCAHAHLMTNYLPGIKNLDQLKFS